MQISEPLRQKNLDPAVPAVIHKREKSAKPNPNRILLLTVIGLPVSGASKSTSLSLTIVESSMIQTPLTQVINVRKPQDRVMPVMNRT